MAEEISESAARAARDLRIAVGRLRRRFREVYDTDELTPSQTSALGLLTKLGPSSASQLAARERVRPQSMAATLGVLTERGLIERTPDPSDGRRQVVSLSAAGRAFVDDSRAVRDEWLVRTLQERYTETERRTLVEAMGLLERLTEA